MPAAGKPRIALLIDAQNVAPDIAGPLLVRLSKDGDPVVRRLYGFNESWAAAGREHAFLACPTVAAVGSKNAADIDLVIGAMDLLQAGVADTFCLVSSDSDFVALALRLREAGRTVIGVGREACASKLQPAYHLFLTIESLRSAKVSVTTAPTPARLNEAKALIGETLRANPRTNGKMSISELGVLMRKAQPAFVSKKIRTQ